MFNSQKPSTEDLPSNGQLLRATGLAVVAASVILTTAILPAEYGIDPAGAGRVLGLTQMGEIKEQLAIEAAADRAAVVGPVEADMPQVAEATSPDAKQEAAANSRSDVTSLTLAPGEGAEIKVDLAEGAAVDYDWSVSGGTVNFDTHADAPGISYHGYDKGKNSPGEQGTLVAAFDGSHGWFWRNRSGGPVTITLRTDGSYTDIKRVV